MSILFYMFSLIAPLALLGRVNALPCVPANQNPRLLNCLFRTHFQYDTTTIRKSQAKNITFFIYVNYWVPMTYTSAAAAPT